MKIINLGHACFKVEGKDFSIIFDPYQDEYVPNLKLPRNLECDYLFISHEHEDHNATNLVKVNNVGQLEYDTILIPHDKNNGLLRGFNKIHIVNVDGFKLVHLGDTGVLDFSLMTLNDVDVLFVPINGFYTISALEAIHLINTIKPKVVIPMHYFNNINKSGYPDGDQIEIFKKHIGEFIELNTYQIEIKKGDKGVIIFKSALN